LTSVDCTDCVTTEQGKVPSLFFTHKENCSGLRYEVALSILSGDIVWIHGPFPCGDWPDIEIFRLSLVHQLDRLERVEADDGYKGEDPEYIKTPSGVVHPQEQLKLRSRVRSRHETVNKRFKQFRCLSGTFRHDIAFHGKCFRAVAILTQLSIENGHPLFPIEAYR
jgi:hypothetical protein